MYNTDDPDSTDGNRHSSSPATTSSSFFIFSTFSTFSALTSFLSPHFRKLGTVGGSARPIINDKDNIYNKGKSKSALEGKKRLASPSMFRRRARNERSVVASLNHQKPRPGSLSTSRLSQPTRPLSQPTRPLSQPTRPPSQPTRPGGARQAWAEMSEPRRRAALEEATRRVQKAVSKRMGIAEGKAEAALVPKDSLTVLTAKNTSAVRRVVAQIEHKTRQLMREAKEYKRREEEAAAAMENIRRIRMQDELREQKQMRLLEQEKLRLLNKLKQPGSALHSQLHGGQDSKSPSRTQPTSAGSSHRSSPMEKKHEERRTSLSYQDRMDNAGGLSETNSSRPASVEMEQELQWEREEEEERGAERDTDRKHLQSKQRKEEEERKHLQSKQENKRAVRLSWASPKQTEEEAEKRVRTAVEALPKAEVITWGDGQNQDSGKVELGFLKSFSQRSKAKADRPGGRDQSLEEVLSVISVSRRGSHHVGRVAGVVKADASEQPEELSPPRVASNDRHKQLAGSNMTSPSAIGNLHSPSGKLPLRHVHTAPSASGTPPLKQVGTLKSMPKEMDALEPMRRSETKRTKAVPHRPSSSNRVSSASGDCVKRQPLRPPRPLQPSMAKKTATRKGTTKPKELTATADRQLTPMEELMRRRLEKKDTTESVTKKEREELHRLAQHRKLLETFQQSRKNDDKENVRLINKKTTQGARKSLGSVSTPKKTQGTTPTNADVARVLF
eukprot:gb/GEZN01001227.1/.p1 GENE.gb/GEZN01001227.1/~~gb/GEZN01001227.1/.p1  ORF type:complete len:852 (+),score=245.56 gb/GEZN01001227.1/:370-2556(+)